MVFIPQPVQCVVSLAFYFEDALLKVCDLFAQGKFPCICFSVNIIKYFRPYFPDTDRLRMGLSKLHLQLTYPGILFAENGLKLFLHLHIFFSGFKSLHFIFCSFKPYS